LWQQVLTLPDDPVVFLTAKRAERARQLQSQGRRPEVYTIDRMIEQAKRAPGDFRIAATRVPEHLERERQRLLRHLSRGAMQPSPSRMAGLKACATHPRFPAACCSAR